MAIQLDCQHCASRFSVPPSKSKARYCSAFCYEASRARVRRTCPQCRTEFWAKPSRADQTHCGHECMYAHRAANGFDGGVQLSGADNPRFMPRAVRECEWCHATFEIPPYRLGRNNQGRFCSTNCNGASGAMKQNRRSKGELVFVEALRSVAPGFETGVPVGCFIVDVLFPQERVAVEFDGFWHTLPHVAAKDQRKDAFLREKGFSVVRVRSDDFRKDAAACINRVAAALHNAAEDAP